MKRIFLSSLKRVGFQLLSMNWHVNFGASFEVGDDTGGIEDSKFSKGDFGDIHNTPSLNSRGESIVFNACNQILAYSCFIRSAFCAACGERW